MDFKQEWAEKDLKVTDYLDYGLEFCRKNIKSFILLLLVVHIPVNVVIAFSGSVNSFQNLISEYDDSFFLSNIIGWVIALVLSSLYSFIVPAVYMSVAYFCYRKMVFGDSPGVKKCYKKGFSALPQMIIWNLLVGTVVSAVFMVVYFLILIIGLITAAITGTAIVVAICIITLLLVFFICIIYFYCRFIYVQYIVVIDQTTFAKAAKKSFAMTKGNVWKTIKLFVSAFILLGYMPSLFNVLLMFVPFNDLLISRIFSAVLTGVTSCIAPIEVFIFTFVYLKYKKDQGELDLLQKIDNITSQHNRLEEKGPASNG